MKIHEDVKEYAKKTMMTMEQAKIRCDYYKKQRSDFEKEVEKARICPDCKKAKLVFESGSYEDGLFYTEAECQNPSCGFESDDYPYPEEGDLFDVVLLFAGQAEREGLAETERQIGLSWSEFIKKDTEDLMELSPQ